MSFWVVRKELMKTYRLAVSAGLSRMAAVARPVVARRVKFVGAVPGPYMVAVFDLRSKPSMPSSRPLGTSCQVRFYEGDGKGVFGIPVKESPDY